MIREAVIDGNYRYELTRIWDSNSDILCFMMLNPSTADARKDDPTLRKCMYFAKKLGYGGVVIVNAFAFRSTSPQALKHVKNPVGESNDTYIKRALQICKDVVIAWGNSGPKTERYSEVLSIIDGMHKNCFCLGVTKNGQPKHPLYIRNDAEFMKYEVNLNDC